MIGLASYIIFSCHYSIAIALFEFIKHFLVYLDFLLNYWVLDIFIDSIFSKWVIPYHLTNLDYYSKDS